MNKPWTKPFGEVVKGVTLSDYVKANTPRNFIWRWLVETPLDAFKKDDDNSFSYHYDSYFKKCANDDGYIQYNPENVKDILDIMRSISAHNIFDVSISRYNMYNAVDKNTYIICISDFEVAWFEYENFIQPEWEGIETIETIYEDYRIRKDKLSHDLTIDKTDHPYNHDRIISKLLELFIDLELKYNRDIELCKNAYIRLWARSSSETIEYKPSPEDFEEAWKEFVVNRYKLTNLIM